MSLLPRHRKPEALVRRDLFGVTSRDPVNVHYITGVY